MINLHHLRYFWTIAREGSFTKAARLLHVSQPALSSAVQQLESHLQTTLFIREHAGVSLTSTGALLVQHAERLLASLEETEQAIRGLESEDIGHFILGCPDVLGAYFLPPVLRDLFQNAPKIQVSLWNGPSPAVHQAILERRCHFGLLVNPFPHPDLVITSLFRDLTGLFLLAPGPPPLQPLELQPSKEALCTGPLFFLRDLPQTSSIVRLLDQEALLPPRQIACGSYELVKSFALAGIGVSILPHRVAAHLQPGSLRPLHPSLPSVEDAIALVYRSDLHRTAAWRRLRDLLLHHAALMGTT